MNTENIDKTVQALKDILVVYKDVREAKESDDKITLAEGGVLVIKHAGKAIRFIGALPEISKEIIDTDVDEAIELVDIIVDEFGGSDEAKKALRDITKGAGLLNSGIRKLIEIGKGKDNE